MKPKTETERMNKAMLAVCENMEIASWEQIKPRVGNELHSFVLMLSWLKEMRAKNEIDSEQARIHIDIQKNTMRTRLMAMPGIDMRMAEKIINTSIDAIRKEIYDYLGWVIA